MSQSQKSRPSSLTSLTDRWASEMSLVRWASSSRSSSDLTGLVSCGKATTGNLSPAQSLRIIAMNSWS